MKVFLIVLITLLFFSNVLCIRELLYVDCEGGVHVFPNSTVYTYANVKNYRPIAEYFLQVLYEKAQCYCPKISLEDFERFLIPLSPRYLFNIFRGYNLIQNIKNCEDVERFFSFFNSSFSNSSFAFRTEFVLPETCTEEEWDKNGVCLMQWSIPKNNITMQLAVAKCPRSIIPYVSLGCEGSGCDFALRPCDTDADCGGKFHCNDWKAYLNDNGNVIYYNFPSSEQFVSLLRSLNLFDETYMECDNFQNPFTSFLNYLRRLIWGAPGINQQKHARLCFFDSLSLRTNTSTDLRIDECDQTFKTFYNICIQYYFDEDCQCEKCYGYMNVTLLTKIDCVKANVVTNWNGIRGGELVVSEKWKTGEKFKVKPFNIAPQTPGAIPIFKMECDGGIRLFPNSAWGLSVNATILRSVYEWVYNEIYKIKECNAQSRDMKMNQFIFNLLHNLPSSLLYQFTTPTPNFHLDEYFKHGILSWLIYPSDDPQPNIRFTSIETCNFDTFINKGICSASYTGLSDLFGIDLKINAYVKKCSNNEFPEIYVECEGGDCSILQQPKFCSSNHDCSSFASCISYTKMIESIGQKYSFPIDDFLDYFLSFSSTSNSTCRTNPSPMYNALKNILKIWAKDPNPKDKVCAFSIDHFFAAANSWAESQVKQDGIYYTIIELSPWKI